MRSLAGSLAWVACSASAASAAPSAAYATASDLEVAGRACLGVVEQQKFDVAVLEKDGWFLNNGPEWATKDAARGSYGKLGSIALVTVSPAEMFPLARICYVRAPFVKKSDFSNLANETAGKLGIRPLDLSGTPIKAEKNELFFGGGDQPMVAITKEKIGKSEIVVMSFMGKRKK